MPSPTEPGPRVTVTYTPEFAAELQAMDRNAAQELVRQIKRAFQTPDWEKAALTPMNDKRVFYLPKVGGYTIVGGKTGKHEVVLLAARRS